MSGEAGCDGGGRRCRERDEVFDDVWNLVILLEVVMKETFSCANIWDEDRVV